MDFNPVLIGLTGLLVVAFLFKFLLPGKTRRQHRPTPRSFSAKASSDKYSPQHPEVLIIGGGVAGCALAKAFSDQGRFVVVIERDMAEPDRIVGELLQPGGVKQLQKLGLEDCVEGIDGQVATGYAVYNKISNEWVQLPFPIDKATNKEHRGISFHHGRFIMNLRKRAQQCQNVTFIEATATQLLMKDGRYTGAAYKVKGDSQAKEIEAGFTIVCDGCFSKFRKDLVQFAPKTVSHFVGVVMENTKLPYEGNGHVFLVDPSPVLSYRIGTNEIRVLVDVPGDALPSNLAEHLKTITAPQLPESIRKGFTDAVDKGQIRSMPNQKLHPNPLITPGVLPIGDTYNMRHPLTGGGMTVALSDSVQVSTALRDIPDLGDSSAVMDALIEFYDNRKPLASTVNILAFALYSIFCGGSDDIEVVHAVRHACFSYFKLGGECVNGPMSLLSAVISDPSTLLSHYVAVALHGAKELLSPPSPKNIWLALKVLRAAFNIFFPLMREERVYPVGIGKSEFVQAR